MQERGLETSFQSFRDQADVRALARVFDAVAPELLAIARHLAPQREDAEDLVQQTFLTAIEKARSFDGSRRLTPWLLGMLALHAHEARARRGRTPDASSVALNEPLAPESEASARELESAVAHAVADMPDAYARLVRRHLLDGSRPSELAREFGLSPGNARVRLHRGMKRLRGALPQGFASFGFGWWSSRGELRRVRRALLEHASAKTGAAVPGSVAPLSWAALAVCAAVATSAVVFQLARPSTRAITADAGIAAARFTENPANGEIAAAREIDVRAAADVRTAAPTSQSGAPGSTSQPSCTIRGRMLLPTGAPAVGARMQCAPTVDSKVALIAPAPLEVAGDGTFEFAFDAPPKLAMRLTAVLDHYATISWRWSDVGARAGIELGDVAFERAGALSVSIADEHGSSLCAGWRVSLFDASEASPRGQEMIFRDVDCAGSGPIVVDDLAARHYSVRAVHGFAAETEWNTADVVADRASELELVYRGPDPNRRIGVEVRFAPACKHSELAAEHLHLVARDGASTAATAIADQPNRFVFDDVAGDGYELVVGDERFLAWRRAGIAAGESITVELMGAASIALRVRDPAGDAIERYSLLASSIEPDRWSAASQLLELGDAPPPGGVFAGFLPGDASLEVCLDASESKLEIGRWVVQPAGSATAIKVRVDALRAGEVRAVDVSFGAGSALGGRVFASDRVTPAAGIVAELYRGRRGPSTGATSGLAVSLGDATDGVGSAVVTGDDGSFHFDALPHGEWTVRARWNDLLWVERTVQLGDTATVPSLELVQPPCGWIDGLVEHVELASGTRLVVHASLTGDEADSKAVEVDARDDGAFHLGPLPVGPTRVVALTRPEREAGWGNSGRAITTFTRYANERDIYAVIADRATTVRLDGRELAPGRIRVRVTIDGGSSRGISVYARSCDVEQRQRAVEIELRADVDAAGVCVLDGLRSGDYALSLHTADGSWAWQRDEAVPIAAGDNPELELRIQLVRHVVRVVDAAQRPLAKQALEWRTGAGSCVTHGSTGEHGELELTLPAGQVQFECPGHELADSDVDWKSGADPIVLRVAQRDR